jgi:hypothetical protein
MRADLLSKPNQKDIFTANFIESKKAIAGKTIKGPVNQ